jgi:hypothetical protein
MTVKSAQAVVGGGARPPLFAIVTITYKVVVYTLQLKGQIYSLPLFLRYPYMYSVERNV